MVHEFTVDEHGSRNPKKNKRNWKDLCSMSTDISLTKSENIQNNAKMTKCLYAGNVPNKYTNNR